MGGRSRGGSGRHKIQEVVKVRTKLYESKYKIEWDRGMKGKSVV